MKSKSLQAIVARPSEVPDKVDELIAEGYQVLFESWYAGSPDYALPQFLDPQIAFERDEFNRIVIYVTVSHPGR
jgi:hypothetical protein